MRAILVVDDHAVVRAGLRQIISAAGDMRVAGEASSAREVLELITTREFDAVVLDISLRDGSGLDILPELKRRLPTTPVLMLSMYGEEEFAIRAIRLGASGYLTKESAPERLLEALSTVIGGGTYVTPQVAEMLALQLRRPSRHPHDRLSQREFGILCLFGEGKTATEIGRLCGVSVKTVSSHRRNILEKMGLSTTAQLVRYAIENKLTRSSSMSSAGPAAASDKA